MTTPAQRFTRAHPCPICGGWQSQPRGRGLRCSGYLDDAGEYARCSREERAGQLEQNPDGTYSHRLRGPCRCGAQHGPPVDPGQPLQAVGGRYREVRARNGLRSQLTERRDQIRDLEGHLLGYHCRVGSGPSKRLWWESPEGRPGLNGTTPTGMLYGLQRLRQLPGATVVLVEGEPAADALQAALADGGWVVLGTVCGAAATPSAEVLRHLAGRLVMLWPDADSGGGQHMRRIGQLLREAGAEVRVVRWRDAPPRADAQDYLRTHGPAALRSLLAAAEPWEPAAVDTGTSATSPPPAARTPPAPPDQPSPEAFYGLLGKLARFTTGYVESDPTSVLVQLLVTFGVAVGVGPYFTVGVTRHHPTLYTGLIGRSSRGRKGTGWDAVEVLFRAADPDFADRILSGIGSGEKLVHLVRDPDPERGDPGAPDRRLLLRESELAGLLAVVNREGSTLSARLREAFDGKPMHNAVKRDPARSTSHRIGLVGHCTPDELRSGLREEQIRNGLANRVLWVVARREVRLPNPPPFTCADDPEVDQAAASLHGALQQARGIRQLVRSGAAERIWDEWYLALPDDQPGLIPAITERAEALVARLAMIFALTDASSTISPEHLTAALALWDYSAACAEHIWGGTTGDLMADRVLEELAYGPLLQSEVSAEVFSRNVSGQRLEEIRRLLERLGRISVERVPAGTAGGRPALRWVPTDGHGVFDT